MKAIPIFEVWSIVGLVDAHLAIMFEPLSFTNNSNGCFTEYTIEGPDIDALLDLEFRCLKK